MLYMRSCSTRIVRSRFSDRFFLCDFCIFIENFRILLPFWAVPHRLLRRPTASEDRRGYSAGLAKGNRKEFVGNILSLGALVKRPKGAVHWWYLQRPNLLLQGIAAVKVGPYVIQSAGSRCSQNFEEFLHIQHLSRLLMYGLQLPGGKVVGTKLRKDDRSAFSAFYFNSAVMWKEESGPTTTEALTNALSTLNGQLPHPPRKLCLPLVQWWLWPTMSFFLATGHRPCTSCWGLEKLRSFHTPMFSFWSDACWAHRSLSWPGRG